jgi:hypothetical protein
MTQKDFNKLEVGDEVIIKKGLIDGHRYNETHTYFDEMYRCGKLKIWFIRYVEPSLEIRSVKLEGSNGLEQYGYTCDMLMNPFLYGK